jgi:dihydroorotase
LIRAARLEGLPVTAEVTPHHLALTDDWVAGGKWAAPGVLERWGRIPTQPYDTSTKVAPPLRTEADVAACLAGLKDGVFDAIATDHAPHTTVDKECEYAIAASGISGSETALGLLMWLVHRGDLDLRTMIRYLTVEPARAFKLPYGTLHRGAAADVAVIDPDREWRVDPSRFHSMGKNTPLAGVTLKGKVTTTVVAGRVVYSA